MAEKTIKSEWERFAEAVIGGQLPDGQKRQAEQSFYAGASAMWFILRRSGVFDYQDKEAAEDIAKPAAECDEFVKHVLREHRERN